MYSIVIVLVFVSSVSARIPLKMAGSFEKIKQEHPEPCCRPTKFTEELMGVVTSTENGELFEEYVDARVGYDSVEEKEAAQLHLGFSNGTKETLHKINLYTKGVAYLIYKLAEGDTCYKEDLKESFQEDCIPDDASYDGTVTFGDRALEVDLWSAKRKEHGVDLYISGAYVREECVAVEREYRAYDSETDEQLYISSTTIDNFNLGISDDDDIFEIPDICDESRVSKGTTMMPERVTKLLRLLRRAGFGN